jgi:hypothetical protein
LSKEGGHVVDLQVFVLSVLKFADTIGQIWGVFMKDIETFPRMTKKNT